MQLKRTRHAQVRTAEEAMKQAFNFWKHLNPGRVRQTEEIEEDESSSEEDTKKYKLFLPVL